MILCHLYELYMLRLQETSSAPVYIRKLYSVLRRSGSSNPGIRDDGRCGAFQLLRSPHFCDSSAEVPCYR